MDAAFSILFPCPRCRGICTASLASPRGLIDAVKRISRITPRTRPKRPKVAVTERGALGNTKPLNPKQWLFMSRRR